MLVGSWVASEIGVDCNCPEAQSISLRIRYCSTDKTIIGWMEAAIWLRLSFIMLAGWLTAVSRVKKYLLLAVFFGFSLLLAAHMAGEGIWTCSCRRRWWWFTTALSVGFAQWAWARAQQLDKYFTTIATTHSNQSGASSFWRNVHTVAKSASQLSVL